MKKKVSTIIILLITFILAGVAIFTAVRLYQLRQTSITPLAPSSKPAAQEVTTSCILEFSLTQATGTAVGTSTAVSTSTAQSTSTAASTATASSTPNPSGAPNSCNGTCGSNSNCSSDLICSNGFCRNPSCIASSNCICGSSAPTSEPTLPESGSSWPTIIGAGLGILVIIGSLLIAL